MTDNNADQIAEWNGDLGRRWAELQEALDRMTQPFGAAALQAAAAQSGERVIDIGCGCGDTSITLAHSVGSAGSVLDIDVSQPMLKVARARAAGLPALRLAFSDADASAAELPTPCDLLFSRFGVMFFDQPTPAFTHLRAALRPGGRCAFVCWRTPRDNAWVMTPLSAARAALGVTPAPADPFAPGPFAFADGDRLRGILADAGYIQIALQRFDAPVFMGTTAREAAENAARMGPVSRFVREMGAEHLPAILAAVEQSVAPFAAADGSIALNGSTWVVMAVNPG